MGNLLTDDEIVTLAAAAGVTWPFGLNTVAAKDDAVAAAAFRGGRSLAVRGLADPDAGRLRPQQDLMDLVGALAASSTHVVAQVCERALPAVPRGAMVLAGRTPEGWVIDSVTSAGVHVLRRGTDGEVSDLILRFVTEVWRSGVSGPDDGRYGLLVTGSPAGRRMSFVQEGQTELLIRSEGGFEVPAGKRTEPWTADDLADYVGRPTG